MWFSVTGGKMWGLVMNNHGVEGGDGFFFVSGFEVSWAIPVWTGVFLVECMSCH